MMRVRIEALFLIAALSTFIASRAPAADPAPADQAILEIDLPAGAKVLDNGQPVQKTRFTYQDLKPAMLYSDEVQVRLADGGLVSRRIVFKAGWRVKLPIRPADAQRPEVYLQHGHSGFGVKQGVFSPDSRYLLTADDSNAIISDAETGEPLRTFPHQSQLLDIGFVGDGRRVFTVTQMGGFFLWDRDTGRKLDVIRLQNTLMSAAVTPDGRYALLGDSGNFVLNQQSYISVRDLASGQEVGRLSVSEREIQTNLDTAWIERILTSADGRHVAAVIAYFANGLRPRVDFAVRVWTDRRLVREVKVPKLDIRAAALSPDGSRLLLALEQLFGAAKVQWQLWNVNDGSMIKDGTLAGNLPATAFTPDGKEFAVGANALTFWSTDGLKEVRRIARGGVDGHGLAFSPDGKRFLAWDKVWDRDGKAPRWTVRKGHRHVGQFRFAPDSRRLFLGDSWDFMELDLGTGRGRRWPPDSPSREGKEQIRDWDVSASRRHIVWVAQKGTTNLTYELVVQDATTGKEVSRFPASLETFPKSNLVSDDGTMALTSSSKTAVLRRALAGAREETYDSEPYDTVGKALSPTGRYVLVKKNLPSATSYTSAWDTEAGREVSRLQLQQGESMFSVYGNTFTPDGRYAVSYGRWGTPGRGVDDTVVLWDPATGTVVRSFAAGLNQMGVNDVRFSRDGLLLLATLHNQTAVLWDVASGTLLRRYVTGFMYPADLSPDGRFVATRTTDEMIHVWDVATGDELAALTHQGFERDHWLAVTPDGLFDGPEAVRRDIKFRIGGGLTLVPLERFFQDFYRPGLLAEIFGGDRPAPEVQFAKQHPPTLRIISPALGGPVEGRQVVIQAEATDQGGGVKGPWLLHNGARVLAPGQAERTGKLVNRSFAITLVPGENKLEVCAACEDGSWESEPARISFRLEKPLEKSDLHVLAIGVSKYASDPLALRYAAPDARAIAELFRRRGPALYNRINVTTLLDDQVTAAGIRQAFDKLKSQARPQDTLLVFLAGHGTMVGQRYFFIPADFKPTVDKPLADDVKAQGLAGDELADLMGATPCLKRVLVLDTCASGGAVPPARTGRNPFAFRGAVERLSRSQGVFTIAAAAATEEAQEVKELGHGILTYTLLAGLKAVKSGPLEAEAIKPNNPEQVAEVLEWFGYASGHVPRMMKRYFGKEQDVQSSGQGASFPILPIRDK